MGVSTLPGVDTDGAAGRAARLAARSINGKQELVDLALTVCDLTSLESTDTPRRVADLVNRALTPDPQDPDGPTVAAVCVHTDLVAAARTSVAAHGSSSPLAVAAACGAFPHGRASLAAKLADIADAIDAGADELDVVIDRAALLDGRHQQVFDELAAMRSLAGARPLKVIIESGELGTLVMVRAASWLALSAGADFVKTSTGKGAVGATREAALVICETVRAFADRHGQLRGVKISGGVKTAKEAMEYLTIAGETLGWEAMVPDRFRLGASTLVDDLVLQRRRSRDGGHPNQVRPPQR